MAEGTLFVEGDAARRFQIRIYAGSGGDPGVQRGDPWKARSEPCHRAREGLAQPGNELKQ